MTFPPEGKIKAMPKQEKEKLTRPKITIIPGRGVAQTINYLLEDRDDLEWIIAVGRTKNGELFFYDTGGDIVEDLGHARIPEGPNRARALRRRIRISPRVALS